MREILIAVTFREFNGDVNSKIQDLFLDSIKKQTYQKFRLVVTNFRETTVKKRIDKSGIPYEWHQSNTPDIWHSFTEVFGNTFKHLEKDKNILLYTNADNIFETNFFEEIIKHFEPYSAGTSYPHRYFFNIEDFRKGKLFDPYNYRRIRSIYEISPTVFVPDVIYLDADTMLSSKNQQLFSRHKIVGAWPGIAQSLMIAFFASKFRNLFYKTQISCIQNNRSFDKREKEDKKNVWIKREKAAKEKVASNKLHEWEKNTSIVLEFCWSKGIEKIFWGKTLFTPYLIRNKFFQHRRYKIIGSLKERLCFSLYLWIHVIIDLFLRSYVKFKKVFKYEKI